MMEYKLLLYVHAMNKNATNSSLNSFIPSDLAVASIAVSVFEALYPSHLHLGTSLFHQPSSSVQSLPQSADIGVSRWTLSKLTKISFSGKNLSRYYP